MRPSSVIGRSGVSLFVLVAAANSAFAARPEVDVSAASRPAPAAITALQRAKSDPALARIGTLAHVDERYGVPTFIWATRSPAAPTASAQVQGSPEQAARSHLARLAPYYGLDASDVASATVHFTHNPARGGIIVSFKQSMGGVEVFRDEVKVLMDRNLGLVAVSGYIPGKAEAGKAGVRAFRGTAAASIGRALDDFAGASVDRGSIRLTGPAPGGYQRFTLASGASLPEELTDLQPIRSKRVLFHLPGQLVPAYYVELMTPTAAVAYVISDVDGTVLFRHNQMDNDSYTYRVWADASTIKAPLDGPQGNAPTPHPTGNPDFYNPSFIAPTLTTLQNGPISTNDPWLPPSATVSTGNNVDAYADLASPDGFSAGDLRATTTSANTFDRTYDTSQPPNFSTDQQRAAVTQLFYDNNFFHDWYYDSGFDEAAGNAQTDNYSRGGLEGDAIHAEAQDFGGTNNANMSTPADGSSPRMQMYVFNLFTRVRINSPGSIAGDKTAAFATFGPQSFSVTADVVLVNDGVGTVTDGCQAIVNSVTGKIALIDQNATCTIPTKVLNAQAAGAVGVIIVNTAASVSTMTGSGAITIPTLMVGSTDGAAIKTALGSGTVNATLLRALSRDGTIDNQIVAHEWFHYLSNRLVGDASGLSNQQGGGMGEGWSDFNAMLMTVKSGDELVASNPNFSGVYAMASYALQNSVIATNAYYFGIRRYPYSTDLNKNPLTFKHIQDGQALPAGPPVAFGASGASNSEVHNTGEVWCNMLWECYAALLRDTGRLTFDQARDRMRQYLVAGLKMTPNAPTILEARDALLAAAYANDPLDLPLMCGAFARRGAGVNAVGPDRGSIDNVGVTESFVCGGELQVVSMTLDDAVHSCDSDGYLDEGETGNFTVTLKNTGSTTLSATTATLSSTNPAVHFLSGNTLAFPSSSPYGTTSASTRVYLLGASGIQAEDIQVQYNDPGLAVAGPRTANFATRGNADEIASSNENVEAMVPPWTMSGTTTDYWQRQQLSALSHRFWGPDPGTISDQYLISPSIILGAGAFSFTFKHAYSFEFSSGTYWDGGVIEISDNNGASWTDLGPYLSPGYNGSIFVGGGNPLSGRSAYANVNASYPAMDLVTANLGTAYANKTVKLRFRVGADEAVNAPGWFVDDLQFTGILNQPFLDVVADPGPCTAVAVEAEPLPSQVEFALAGPNPSAERAEFRFALPEPTQVHITIHDVSGRLVATVADGSYPAGYHTATWGAETGSHSPTSGVYFAQMTANGRRITRRLLMLSR